MTQACPGPNQTPWGQAMLMGAGSWQLQRVAGWVQHPWAGQLRAGLLMGAGMRGPALPGPTAAQEDRCRLSGPPRPEDRRAGCTHAPASPARG